MSSKLTHANSMQVGGSHYKTEYQHWDWVPNVGLPYYLAQISRYVTRWRKKNGLEDVRKAIHYTQKQIEYHTQMYNHAVETTKAFCTANNCGEEETEVLYAIVAYHRGSKKHLFDIENMLQSMLATLEGKPRQVKGEAVDPEFRENGDEWRR